jgi:hypothetical protein
MSMHIFASQCDESRFEKIRTVGGTTVLAVSVILT